MNDTSWENSEKWYDAIVGKEGHYYHKQIVLPGVLRLLALKQGDSLLDLACGQGVLARSIPNGVDYCGVDLSPSLIQSAKAQTKRPNTTFVVGDISENLPVSKFSHGTIILALQNVEHGDKAVQQASKHIDGTLIIVLNHPTFRIPRQSQWGVDDRQKMQYRRVDRYMSPLKVPIQTSPGKGQQSETTWSFHHPLSTYCKWLHDAGFVIETLEEWVSDKKSEGRNAKMEDRARAEFPLFLAIKSRKKSLL